MGQGYREKPFKLKYDNMVLTVSRETCTERKLRRRGRSVKRKLNRERNKQRGGGGQE
jgi:hypothetical protein